MSEKIITFDEGSIWKNAYPEGATKQDILNELSDYEALVGNASTVYCTVTGGLISKVNTCAFEIVGAFNTYVEKLCKQAVEDYKETQE